MVVCIDRLRAPYGHAAAYYYPVTDTCQELVSIESDAGADQLHGHPVGVGGHLAAAKRRQRICDRAARPAGARSACQGY